MSATSHGPRAARRFIRNVASRSKPVNLRDLARSIIALREADMRAVHSSRSGCLGCALASGILAAKYGPRIPAHFHNERFYHERIAMPAARALARHDTEENTE